MALDEEMLEGIGMDAAGVEAPQARRLLGFGHQHPGRVEHRRDTGIDLDRLAPGQPGRDVGTMDHRVVEQTLVGLAMAARITTAWEMWLAIGVLLDIAPGLNATQMNAAVASRWFSIRRAFVRVMLGGAAEAAGWRTAMMIPMARMAATLPLILPSMRERPSDLGLPAFGDAAIRPPPPCPEGNFGEVRVAALRLAMRGPVFWVLAGTFFVCAPTSPGITQTHLVPFRGDPGISPVSASWLLAVIGICDLARTIASGWLSDRHDNRWMLRWYHGFRGSSPLWLALGDTPLAALAIFAVVFGLDDIATVPPTTKLAIAAFGRQTGPVVIAWILAALQIGAGPMSYGAGLGGDGIGSYPHVSLVAGPLGLVAAAPLTLMRRERHAPAERDRGMAVEVSGTAVTICGTRIGPGRASVGRPAATICEPCSG